MVLYVEFAIDFEAHATINDGRHDGVVTARGDGSYDIRNHTLTNLRRLEETLRFQEAGGEERELRNVYASMEAFLGHKDVSHTIRRHRGTLAERAPDPRPGRELHQQGPPICAAIRVPNAEIYAIDVSFAALADPAERTYLNQQPTSFVLPAEAVDRLRAAAGTIILASPEFQRLLKDVGAKVVADPSTSGSTATARDEFPSHEIRRPHLQTRVFQSDQMAASIIFNGRCGAP